MDDSIKNVWQIPTKIIIDYETVVNLVSIIGEERFVDIINKVVIITADEDSYYYINDVKKNVSDRKKYKKNKSDDKLLNNKDKDGFK